MKTKILEKYLACVGMLTLLQYASDQQVNMPVAVVLAIAMSGTAIVLFPEWFD